MCEFVEKLSYMMKEENSFSMMMYALLSVPTARILGKPEMFVDVGSTINITCVVENAPGNVRWMHKEKVHKVTK